MPKKKVHKLKLDADYGFKLIGIVSSENDYTLIWTVNDSLKISLKKEEKLEIIDKKTNAASLFTRFSYSDENTNYTLIGNKSENGYLIKEQKQIDYFLKIEGKIDFISPNISKSLKKSKVILATFDILPTDLKSKYNLLF